MAFHPSRSSNFLDVGEEACPKIIPAMARAAFKITGKRIRSRPFGNQNLSGG